MKLTDQGGATYDALASITEDCRSIHPSAIATNAGVPFMLGYVNTSARCEVISIQVKNNKLSQRLCMCVSMHVAQKKRLRFQIVAVSEQMRTKSS